MKKKALYFPVVSTLELKVLNYIVTIQCRLEYFIILNSSLDQNYQYYAETCCSAAVFLSQIISVGEGKTANLCRTRVIKIRGDQKIVFHVV